MVAPLPKAGNDARHVETFEGHRGVRQVDQIATLISLQERAELGGQQLFIREGRDIGLS